MRRRKPEKRKVIADPKYKSELIARFINMVMLSGKKNAAESIVYGALESLINKTEEKDNVLKVFSKAIENVRPRVEVKSRRVGGATYQVPIEVTSARGNSLSMRWIRDFARNKKGKPMMDKLADELLSAYKEEGPAIRKRDETHKMAEANKAFSHLKW